MIGGVLSQLISKNLDQQHLMTFFFLKMILTKTRYKTYNSKLLALVEVLKTWRHHLKGFQIEVFILSNHNNLQKFISTKKLSFKQFYQALKLSQYYFERSYYQNKANKAVDVLFQYLYQSAEEKKTFQAKKIKILYCLQSLLAKIPSFLTSHLFYNSFME